MQTAAVLFFGSVSNQNRRGEDMPRPVFYCRGDAMRRPFFNGTAGFQPAFKTAFIYAFKAAKMAALRPAFYKLLVMLVSITVSAPITT